MNKDVETAAKKKSDRQALETKANTAIHPYTSTRGYTYRLLPCFSAINVMWVEPDKATKWE
ncbi:hypothetical protein PM082_014391 [Marasmius tenuissimus]|nr:hypothetical protein PM082_014391 [Marasmius tenuissimus]